jgi:nitrate reductase delta subunit
VLAAAWLLSYPDSVLLDRLSGITAVVDELPASTATPMKAFLAYLSDTPISEVQAHYVTQFDMKRKACPYLTYWTDGDTRNRGRAILRFKQAYLEAGYDFGSEELPDHLCVVLEFAAIGDTLTGEALLAEHQDAIHLLRDALDRMASPYVHVLDAVVATMPRLTPQIRERMAHIAASGPPVESVGLEPFGVSVTIDPIGARR